MRKSAILVIALGLCIISAPKVSNIYRQHQYKSDLNKLTQVNLIDHKNETKPKKNKNVENIKKKKKSNTHIENKNKTNYSSEIVSVKEKNIEKLYQIFKKRNEEYKKRIDSDLESYFTGTEPDNIDLKSYINQEYIGFVVIPKIEISLPIYLGGTNDNLTKGACHITHTSYPIGGESTNSVIVAHRQYTWSRMFNDIDKLKKGDIVRLITIFGNLEYEMEKSYQIDFQNKTPTNITKGKDQLTLVSCVYNKKTKTFDRFVVELNRKK